MDMVRIEMRMVIVIMVMVMIMLKMMTAMRARPTNFLNYFEGPSIRDASNSKDTSVLYWEPKFLKEQTSRSRDKAGDGCGDDGGDDDGDGGEKEDDYEATHVC